METKKKIKLIECPRDAMQGWERFIPSEIKAGYLNSLLAVGFDTLDCGSFVSPKAIPQMADTAKVLSLVYPQKPKTKLLVIVANERGVQDALNSEKISYLGYPFSVSETFQLRNTNKTIAESWQLIRKIQPLCATRGKELVIYVSMGFGNPYGEPYSEQIVEEWVEKFAELGIKIISLSDTVGMANPHIITRLFSYLVPLYPDIEFGAHFHSTPDTREEKIKAAFDNGCCRFDGAIGGYGGCPMVEDELVGNMATETLISFFEKQDIAPIEYDRAALEKAKMLSVKVFV